MPSIGLLKPYYAIYGASGSTVTYTGGASAGKYVSMELSIETGDQEKFYADDGESESDQSKFVSGTVTNSTDDLRPDIMESLLGLHKTVITPTTGYDTTNPAWLDYDDQQNIPFVGWGGVIRKMVGHEEKFVAFAFPKLRFRNPDESYETKGKTINWITPKLVADIYRSDAADHKWHRKSNFLVSLADAEKMVKDFLSIT